MTQIDPMDLSDYQELMISLTSARELAAEQIRQYKHLNARQMTINVGAWILVHFPQDKSGSSQGHGTGHTVLSRSLILLEI